MPVAPELPDLLRSALSRWAGTKFSFHRYEDTVFVSWADGPTAPTVLPVLAAAVPAPAPVFHLERSVSLPYLCAALDLTLSRGGFVPELVDAAFRARAEEEANPPMDGFLVGFRELRRHGWANHEFIGFARDVASRMSDGLALVDLSGAPLDVLRPGVPGVPSRVEVMAALARDAGISEAAGLVLWAASGGFDVAAELSSRSS